MIIFLYGDDSFRSHEKLMEIKTRYLEKAGDLNLVVLEDGKLTAEELARQINVLPFLASSRLIIVKNACQTSPENQQKIIKIISRNISDSTNLVFHENKTPDKRGALFKNLLKTTTTQEFPLLDNRQLSLWLKKRAENLGIKIDSDISQKLILFCGNDTGRLNQELIKLNNFDENITVENIDALVKPIISADIFSLVDAVGAKNIDQAQKILADLIKSGQNEIYILTMLVYGWRNLLLLKFAKNPYQVRMHPFVRQKTLAMANRFGEKELKDGYAKILEADIAMKTGTMENKLALEILLTKLAR